MHSSALANQSEIQETCIEFVINNVSPQRNIVKINLNLKVVEIFRDCRDNIF